MNKTCRAVSILIIFCLIGGLSDLRAETYRGRPLFQEETDRSVLFNRVVVYQKEGGPRSGLLVGTEQDSLIVLIAQKNEKIPFQNLALEQHDGCTQ